MEEKKEKEQVYELVEVPTQYTVAVKTPTGELITHEQATVEILNIVSELKKNLLTTR